MSDETGSDLVYQNALTSLASAGVFKNQSLTRDGHISAMFAEASVRIVGSTLADRPITESELMQLFGLLLAAAAERGLDPAKLLAIGMAAVLNEQKP